MCSSPMLVTTATSPSTMLVEFEPAAEADLDHRPGDARLAKDHEGRERQEIEPGRVRRGGPLAPRRLVGVERARERLRQRVRVDVTAVQAHALGHTLDMGRGVAADAQARAARAPPRSAPRPSPCPWCRRRGRRGKRFADRRGGRRGRAPARARPASVCGGGAPSRSARRAAPSRRQGSRCQPSPVSTENHRTPTARVARGKGRAKGALRYAGFGAASKSVGVDVRIDARRSPAAGTLVGRRDAGDEIDDGFRRCWWRGRRPARGSGRRTGHGRKNRCRAGHRSSDASGRRRTSLPAS